MSRKPKKPLNAAVIVAIDLLLTASLLLSFCYFHHVKKLWGLDSTATDTDSGSQDFTKPIKTTTKTPTTSTVPTTDTPSTGSADVTTSEKPVTPTYDTSGDFGEKFGMLFSSDDSITVTDDSYQSHDIYMKLTSFDGKLTQAYYQGGATSSEHVVYYVIDVYVRNVENLYTSYAKGYLDIEDLVDIDTAGSKIVDTIAAISGDLYYGYDKSKKVIVRNGNIIRKSSYITEDICVLYWDGSMETISPEEYDWDEIAAKGPYQIWSFGPALMDGNGNALTDIDSSLWRWNPRAAIGCVEPGHYVLAVVNGYRNNNEKASHGVGVNLDVLAQIMEDAGCKSAYNLDGGASTYGWYRGDLLVKVANANGSERHISDIICIGEIVGSTE
jgi:hypothetical protein